MVTYMYITSMCVNVVIDQSGVQQSQWGVVMDTEVNIFSSLKPEI